LLLLFLFYFFIYSLNPITSLSRWPTALSSPKIAPTKGIVGREEIEMMVRKVMAEQEGKAMRDRVKELKNSGGKGLE
jgi:hypothetical protein